MKRAQIALPYEHLKKCLIASGFELDQGEVVAVTDVSETRMTIVHVIGVGEDKPDMHEAPVLRPNTRRVRMSTAKPMTTAARQARYEKQNGRMELSPRQQRQIRKAALRLERGRHRKPKVGIGRGQEKVRGRKSSYAHWIRNAYGRWLRDAVGRTLARSWVGTRRRGSDDHLPTLGDRADLVLAARLDHRHWMAGVPHPAHWFQPHGLRSQGQCSGRSPWRGGWGVEAGGYLAAPIARH